MPHWKDALPDTKPILIFVVGPGNDPIKIFEDIGGGRWLRDSELERSCEGILRQVTKQKGYAGTCFNRSRTTKFASR